MMDLVPDGLAGPTHFAALGGTCERVYDPWIGMGHGPGWSCHDTSDLVPGGLANPNRFRGLRDRSHQGALSGVAGVLGPI